MSDLDHGPETCNYVACRSTSGTPCPFVRGEKTEVQTVKADCKHEWRFLRIIETGSNIPGDAGLTNYESHDCFYCIQCLQKKVV